MAQRIDVAPDIASSIETRVGTEAFSGTDLEAWRAGTPVDGGGFEARLDPQPDSIFFRNGGIALGAIGVISSATRLDLTLTNEGADPLIVRSFESVIIPAGFGFHTTIVAGGCSPLSPAACGSRGGPASGFDALFRPAGVEAGDMLGRVGFRFQLLVDGVERFGVESALAIVQDPVSGANRIVESFGAGPALLNGWRLNATPGDPSVIGYAWDSTSFVVELGGRLLLPGEAYRVSYVATVFAESYAVGGLGMNGGALLGYSAFGDPPIGRPGGGGSLAGVEIGSFAFGPPVWDIDRIVMPAIDTAVPGVPEPAAWTLLIAGFALVGGMARRHRTALA